MNLRLLSYSAVVSIGSLLSLACDSNPLIVLGALGDSGESSQSNKNSQTDSTTTEGEDGICGTESIPFNFSPPNVLLMLDRSCSMRRCVEDACTQFGTGPDDTDTRWNVARNAIEQLTTRYPSRVQWGLMAFPDARETCDDIVEAEVPPAFGTEEAIRNTLLEDEIQPFGLCGDDNTDKLTQPRVTPVVEPLEAALSLDALNDDSRSNYVILIADGGASCSQNAADLTIPTKALYDAEIRTAVIGFSLTNSQDTLEAIGENGGLANPSESTDIYGAANSEELNAALDAIVIPAIPCSFDLEKTPPDIEKVFVAANDELLELGAENGFSYDAENNAIVLGGQACEDLRFGVTKRLGVSFGCAPAECVPALEICNGLDDDCDDIVDEGCTIR